MRRAGRACAKTEFPVRCGRESRGRFAAHAGQVGDSRSDLPLWASLGLSAALDASAGAHEEATVTVDDDGLRGVLPALSRLVAATR
ncbi:hypothetical protein AQJ11_35940 [Streptomyces corchorusii]|uniref:Hydrolase n=1 Tax=Streptomyces corchorusii TaxID=1903 RepID=A0A101PUQ0_STRCK|nr:hypothetical protein AQJ11_35940 [Streptomyces corchorusii]